MPALISDHVVLQPPAFVRQGFKLHGKAESVSLAVHIGADGKSVSSSQVSVQESASTDSTSKIEPLIHVNWNDSQEQKKFSLLERKIGRGSASGSDLKQYNTLLASRRAWIASKNYLLNYLEEEREKALLKKLEEIQILLRPISL